MTFRPAYFALILLSTHTFALEPAHQVAVIDAGSSGSRVHIYEWTNNDDKQTINIHEVYNKKIKPGLTSLNPDQDVIDAYLTILMSKTPHTNMPVYLYATAGMRLISKPQQKQYYNAIEHWFNEDTNWQLAAAKTITGKEEGVYGWLSVNYAAGNLFGKDKHLSGVMDMGGASVQISFPLTSQMIAKQENIEDINILGHHYRIFVHSFLGLGQDQVTHQYLNDESCYAQNYLLPNALKGEGSAYSCANDVSQLINQVHHTNKTIKPILKVNPIHDWRVMGGLQTMASYRIFNFKNGTFTPDEFVAQGNNAICNATWDSLEREYSDNQYIFNYCLLTGYYHALITDGYGIASNEPVHYTSEGSAADWTLGVVLKHSSANT